jgi:hypothetical protein
MTPADLAGFPSLLDAHPTLVPARLRYRLPVSGNTSGHSKSCGVVGPWMIKSKG